MNLLLSSTKNMKNYLPILNVNEGQNCQNLPKNRFLRNLNVFCGPEIHKWGK